MTHKKKWVWSALEGLVDLERQRTEAAADLERLNVRVRDEYQRIAEGSGCGETAIEQTLDMIRACGSPLDIEHPREPEADAPAEVDPLNIPPHLDRRAEAAE